MINIEELKEDTKIYYIKIYNPKISVEFEVIRENLLLKFCIQEVCGGECFIPNNTSYEEYSLILSLILDKIKDFYNMFNSDLECILYITFDKLGYLKIKIDENILIGLGFKKDEEQKIYKKYIKFYLN